VARLAPGSSRDKKRDLLQEVKGMKVWSLFNVPEHVSI